MAKIANAMRKKKGYNTNYGRNGFWPGRLTGFQRRQRVGQEYCSC